MTKTYELPEKVKKQVAEYLRINESEISAETVNENVLWINTTYGTQYTGIITKTGNLKKHSISRY